MKFINKYDEIFTVNITGDELRLIYHLASKYITSSREPVESDEILKMTCELLNNLNSKCNCKFKKGVFEDMKYEIPDYIK